MPYVTYPGLGLTRPGPAAVSKVLKCSFARLGSGSFFSGTGRELPAEEVSLWRFFRLLQAIPYGFGVQAVAGPSHANIYIRTDACLSCCKGLPPFLAFVWENSFLLDLLGHNKAHLRKEAAFASAACFFFNLVQKSS